MNTSFARNRSVVNPRYSHQKTPVLNVGLRILNAQQRRQSMACARFRSDAQAVVDFLAPHQNTPQFDEELATILSTARKTVAFSRH